MLDFLDRILWALQRHRRLTLALSVAVVALVGAGFALRGGGAPEAEPLPGGAVAIVGERAISQAEVDRWSAVYRRSGVAGAEPTPEDVTKAVMRTLVAASWTEQEAAARRVSVPDTEITKLIEENYAAAEKRGVSKAQLLEQTGSTEADLRWQLRISLLAQRLQGAAVAAADAPTEEAVAARYEDEPERWAEPSRRDLQVILLTDEKAAGAALTALRSGRSFAAVAKEYGNPGQGPGATTLRDVRPGRRDPAFERAVLAAPVGRLGGPARVTSGWIVFRVTSSTPLPAIPLAKARKTLTGELTARAQAAAAEAFAADFRSRWRGRTRCAEAVFDDGICGARA